MVVPHRNTGASIKRLGHYGDNLQVVLLARMVAPHSNRGASINCLGEYGEGFHVGLHCSIEIEEDVCSVLL